LFHQNQVSQKLADFETIERLLRPLPYDYSPMLNRFHIRLIDDIEIQVSNMNLYRSNFQANTELMERIIDTYVRMTDLEPLSHHRFSLAQTLKLGAICDIYLFYSENVPTLEASMSI